MLRDPTPSGQSYVAALSLGLGPESRICICPDQKRHELVRADGLSSRILELSQRDNVKDTFPPSADTAHTHYPIRHNGGFVTLRHDGSVKWRAPSSMTDADFLSDTSP